MFKVKTGVSRWQKRPRGTGSQGCSLKYLFLLLEQILEGEGREDPTSCAVAKWQSGSASAALQYWNLADTNTLGFLFVKAIRERERERDGEVKSCLLGQCQWSSSQGLWDPVYL